MAHLFAAAIFGFIRPMAHSFAAAISWFIGAMAHSFGAAISGFIRPTPTIIKISDLNTAQTPPSAVNARLAILFPWQRDLRCAKCGDSFCVACAPFDDLLIDLGGTDLQLSPGVCLAELHSPRTPAAWYRVCENCHRQIHGLKTPVIEIEPSAPVPPILSTTLSTSSSSASSRIKLDRIEIVKNWLSRPKATPSPQIEPELVALSAAPSPPIFSSSRSSLNLPIPRRWSALADYPLVHPPEIRADLRPSLPTPEQMQAAYCDHEEFRPGQWPDVQTVRRIEEAVADDERKLKEAARIRGQQYHSSLPPPEPSNLRYKYLNEGGF
ncbi:hypothetical protein R3P38DRAFT_2793876 [Favolaschia claudopus]|uniref:FYVE zinc finger domain-containing protein n=1 Tax=Favolaschia claudopus TaxID=2862362 RepID=A0AAW0AA48_9AGAR